LISHTPSGSSRARRDRVLPLEGLRDHLQLGRDGADAHARAFTVAKVMRMDVLTSIREELDRALAEPASPSSNSSRTSSRGWALGWWGKRVVERPDGTAQIVNVSSPHRLETIYRTNLQSSYMAGRYRDLH
jgi:uncharacterized protein with gpF-like domain